MKISRRIFTARVLAGLCLSAFAAVLLLASGCASTKTDGSHSQTKPLRVLFIGNSYTYVNMLPEMLQQFALAGKQRRPLAYRMIAPGGCSLEKHWKDGVAPKAVAEGGWDYVVLQDHSMGPVTNAAILFQYARLFDREIRKSGAKTVFYVTWARKKTPAAQSEITTRYAAIAAELGALCGPVGPARAAVGEKRPDLELYQIDGSHPSAAGTYLAACVFYNVLYGASPVGMPEAVVGKTQGGKPVSLAALGAEDAKLLQQTARQTVKAWAGGRRRP